MSSPKPPCAVCAARGPVTTLRANALAGQIADPTMGLRVVSEDVFACPACDTRYRRRLQSSTRLQDHDEYHFTKLAEPPRLQKVSVWRCPKCGSTKAGPDESRSAYDLTYMTCLACGNGGLCDSWERDSDWSLDIEIPEGTSDYPDFVPPLAPGAGLYESLARIRANKERVAHALPPSPEPKPERKPEPERIPGEAAVDTFGCSRCCGSDADLAWEAARSRHLHSLIDESHYDISITACDCGQHFAKVFTERVDWVNGEDDQTSLLLPIRLPEVAQMLRCEANGLGRLVQGFSPGRRFVVHLFPSAGSLTTQWRDGGFWIGPHD